jgi:hypothetical protein
MIIQRPSPEAEHPWRQARTFSPPPAAARLVRRMRGVEISLHERAYYTASGEAGPLEHAPVRCPASPIESHLVATRPSQQNPRYLRQEIRPVDRRRSTQVSLVGRPERTVVLRPSRLVARSSSTGVGPGDCPAVLMRGPGINTSKTHGIPAQFVIRHRQVSDWVRSPI